MRVRGLGRVLRAVGRARDRFGPRAVVLLYHRVAKLDCDPWKLAVSPAFFAEQMEVLGRRACVVPVGEMARALRDRPATLSRKVAITFDDGYCDNLLAAKPILEDLRLPATIYMTSGEVGRSREFWWDEMEKIFLQTKSLPERLELSIGGEDRSWTSTDDRDRLYHSIYDLVQGMPREERERTMDLLVDWSGVSRAVRPTHRALTPEETCQLADSDYLEIGAHTVCHQALSTQPTFVQEAEVMGSKTQLEEMIGRKVRTFSYPYGRHTDETVAIVQRGGFENACACLDQVVRRSADPFRLPRLVVEDWDGPTFAARLDQWLTS